jgi:hypothetical protein
MNMAKTAGGIRTTKSGFELSRNYFNNRSERNKKALINFIEKQQTDVLQANIDQFYSAIAFNKTKYAQDLNASINRQFGINLGDPKLMEAQEKNTRELISMMESVVKKRKKK